MPALASAGRGEQLFAPAYAVYSGQSIMVSEGSECPPGDRRTLPETITAGGVTRWLTRHLRQEPDDGVTAARVQYALENWSVRGICENREGNEVSTYWGFVPGRRVMLRVVVSLDDAEIISAHFDRWVTRRIAEAGRPWLRRRCRELEVRDGI